MITDRAIFVGPEVGLVIRVDLNFHLCDVCAK